MRDLLRSWLGVSAVSMIALAVLLEVVGVAVRRRRLARRPRTPFRMPRQMLPRRNPAEIRLQRLRTKYDHLRYTRR